MFDIDLDKEPEFLSNYFIIRLQVYNRMFVKII